MVFRIFEKPKPKQNGRRPDAARLTVNLPCPGACAQGVVDSNDPPWSGRKMGEQENARSFRKVLENGTLSHGNAPNVYYSFSDRFPEDRYRSRPRNMWFKKMTCSHLTCFTRTRLRRRLPWESKKNMGCSPERPLQPPRYSAACESALSCGAFRCVSCLFGLERNHPTTF